MKEHNIKSSTILLHYMCLIFSFNLESAFYRIDNAFFLEWTVTPKELALVNNESSLFYSASMLYFSMSHSRLCMQGSKALFLSLTSAISSN